jgi:aryl-alcohol dehydrogenase-like predicted oxidoreductase
MKMRQLGNTKLKVSEISLGCMGMSEFYGKTDEQEALATLHRALELGVNFYDTADMYGCGANEALLAKAFKQHWHKIILATKFGIMRDPNDPSKRELNGRPEYVKAACDASLQRLGINVIDLYYLHRIDPNVPIEETVGAMADLVREGKVRYLGLSEVSLETLKRAQAIYPITALQSEYSLWTREPERELLPYCEEQQISFVAYSPLGRGFLTNQLKSIEQLDTTDIRKTLPRFTESNFISNKMRQGKLVEMAEAKACTPAQLALAWVLAKSPRLVPIPGTRRRSYLEENIGAAHVALLPEDIKDLDSIFPLGLVAGERYTPAGMKTLDQN